MSSHHELSENKIQSRFVSWCRQNKIFVFAIVNQQPMATCCDNMSIVRRILKKLSNEGMVSGVPDLMIPIPMNGYHGLFIEMKTKTNKTAKEQKKIIQWLSNRNYKCIVPHSVEEATHEVTEYLSNSQP